MHIVVCVKQIPDPEAPFSMFSVDEDAKTVVPAAGLQLVMSPFDEQALEAALRVRDSFGPVKITAISLGPDSARNTLKHALAMGADEGMLINDEAFAGASSELTALALALAITQLRDIDLILTGRQAADWDCGVVGCGIAELLALPVVTFASGIDVSERAARVKRVLDDGFETIEADLPAVVTVSNELGAARTPTLRETMRAARKPVSIKSAADLQLNAEEIARVRSRRVRERLFVPVKASRCEFMAGADESAQGVALAQRLREARLI